MFLCACVCVCVCVCLLLLVIHFYQLSTDNAISVDISGGHILVVIVNAVMH